mmetsp:Transcript_15548/g.30534  ORF Transcript_15548/g.30534 Transcript_15548/m.30534 type:complete len:137 (+) Transcript_15548:3-413(+)
MVSMMMFFILVLCSLGGSRVMLEHQGDITHCKTIQECELCKSSEMDKSHCKTTGKFKKLECIDQHAQDGHVEAPDAHPSRIIFESCDSTVTGASRGFWLFEVAVVICLGVSYWFLQKRNARAQRLHSQRLDRMVNS